MASSNAENQDEAWPFSLSWLDHTVSDYLLRTVCSFPHESGSVSGSQRNRPLVLTPQTPDHSIYHFTLTPDPGSLDYISTMRTDKLLTLETRKIPIEEPHRTIR